MNQWQQGNSTDVIAYADKANERIRSALFNPMADSFTEDDYKALVKKLYDVDLAKLDRNTFSHVEMDYQGNLK
ncbi:MAG: hypothetical protein LKE64_02510 [Solobacterium sp.]|jgi:hypothetical protein|nr:hypothetical protein [Solobacterium sp.]MCH4049686.1 hypothetical protein [Solobacterium sp.]MCH4073371.1 hypothetical protein [Solobacterium sp.]MCI1313030.1 hypothetical protein [Solobacterium sp.]MCI1345537.1 hypothetical protein [Solobacterium sp.]